MTRLGSWLSGATLALTVASLGCGGGGSSSGPASITDVVPRDSAIAGWKIDATSSKTANVVAATATTEIDTENLIDGAAADFFAAPSTPKEFAWQNYVNASLPSPNGATDGAKAKLYILQMPSAEQASSLYTALLQANLYVGNTWADPTSPVVGAKSRITDSGTDWWINFYKGSWYVEVRMTPSYGPSPDYTPGDATMKKAAMDFAVAVAAKM